jgi:hypothetical protein
MSYANFCELPRGYLRPSQAPIAAETCSFLRAAAQLLRVAFARCRGTLPDSVSGLLPIAIDAGSNERPSVNYERWQVTEDAAETADAGGLARAVAACRIVRYARVSHC